MVKPIFIRISLTLFSGLLTIPLFSQDHQLSSQESKLSPKATIKTEFGGTKTEIVYCRPSARGRKMLGGNNPFGQVWRTGANAATTIEFDGDVTIEQQKLPSGKYSLFTIPGENEWVIILNKVHEQWGAYNYDQQEDALRVTVKALRNQSFVETFTILPKKDEMVLSWENFYIPIRITGSR